MATTAPAAPHTRAVESSATWRLSDRIGLAVCWALGLLFCAIVVGIVVYVFVQGVRYLSPSLLATNPKIGAALTETGGFFDPIVGTVIVSVVGMAIALPFGVATAVWLSEYGRPFALARVVEGTIDMLAGIPTIVLALFGLAIFENPALVFLSQKDGHIAYGESFFAAGAILSLIALPLIVGNTREGLQSIPARVREASLAVGKTKFATIRRILLPSARPNVITGAMLGLGRIIGDTAVIVILLGGSGFVLRGVGSVWPLSLLRGTGSTLTSYVYQNAPTGEYNDPQKAFAAAFVLILMVLALNAAVEIAVRRGRKNAWNS